MFKGTLVVSLAVVVGCGSPDSDPEQVAPVAQEGQAAAPDELEADPALPADTCALSATELSSPPWSDTFITAALVGARAYGAAGPEGRWFDWTAPDEALRPRGHRIGAATPQRLISMSPRGQIEVRSRSGGAPQTGPAGSPFEALEAPDGSLYILASDRQGGSQLTHLGVDGTFRSEPIPHLFPRMALAASGALIVAWVVEDNDALHLEVRAGDGEVRRVDTARASPEVTALGAISQRDLVVQANGADGSGRDRVALAWRPLVDATSPNEDAGQPAEVHWMTVVDDAPVTVNRTALTARHLLATTGVGPYPVAESQLTGGRVDGQLVVVFQGDRGLEAVVHGQPGSVALLPDTGAVRLRVSAQGHLHAFDYGCTEPGLSSSECRRARAWALHCGG